MFYFVPLAWRTKDCSGVMRVPQFSVVKHAHCNQYYEPINLLILIDRHIKRYTTNILMVYNNENGESGKENACKIYREVV